MKHFQTRTLLIMLLTFGASGLAMAQVKPAPKTDAMPAVKFAKPKSAEPITAESKDQTPAAKKDEKKADKSVRPDRLDLDTTLVTGNRELPKVLYIVPWKKAELGELPAQPFNTLLDEVLQPVDREVFRREVRYFDMVSSGANQAAMSSPGNEAPK